LGTLLLVRHGQATLGGPSYDALSPRGVEQARHLGRSFADRGLGVTRVVSGPRRRHLDSARALREAAAERGLELPQVVMSEAFDEMDVAPLMSQALGDAPPLPSEDADDFHDAVRRIGYALMKLVERWSQGEAIAGLEPFADFEARVHDGLRAVMDDAGRGATAVVVTSGGPISVAVRLALGLPPVRTAGLMEAICNGSLSELRFRERELSLYRFNETGHLPEAMVTRL
jgi:broad specificity phosphatase PhoE